MNTKDTSVSRKTDLVGCSVNDKIKLRKVTNRKILGMESFQIDGVCIKGRSPFISSTSISTNKASLSS
jgi:hypothetical protein